MTNVKRLLRNDVHCYVTFEHSMGAFGDVIDAHQLSTVRPITPTIHEFVNFTLVVRDLRKDRLAVGVDQKRSAW